MNADLESRLRAKINELETVAWRDRKTCEQETARAWDLECRLDVVCRENVALLAEVRRLKQDADADSVGRGLEG